MKQTELHKKMVAAYLAHDLKKIAQQEGENMTTNQVYFCATCGTTESNDVDGYCINGHDDWLEGGDEPSLFLRASRNTGQSVEAILKILDQ